MWALDENLKSRLSNSFVLLLEELNSLISVKWWSKAIVNKFIFNFKLKLRLLNGISYFSIIDFLTIHSSFIYKEVSNKVLLNFFYSNSIWCRCCSPLNILFPDWLVNFREQNLWTNAWFLSILRRGGMLSKAMYGGLWK